MPGEASPSFLRKLEAKRDQLVNQAEYWLRGIPSGRLTPAQEVEYRTYVDDIRGLADRIRETPPKSSAWAATRSCRTAASTQ